MGKFPQKKAHISLTITETIRDFAYLPQTIQLDTHPKLKKYLEFAK